MKVRKLCLSIGIAFSLAACDFIQTGQEQDVSQIPPASIGAVVSSIDSNPFFQGMYKSFQEVDSENSQLKIQLEASKDDQKLQDSQIEAMLNSGAKALVVNLADASVGNQFAEKMCARQIPVVYINRSPSAKVLQNCNIAYFVGSDDNQAGILQAQLVLENWNEHPEWDKNSDGKMQIAVLEGNPAISSSKIRSSWAVSSLKFAPEIGVGSDGVDIVFMETGRYNQQVANEVVNKWSESPDFNKIEVILAGNDNMALGAADALDSKGKKIPIFGIDGVPKAQDAVKQGRVYATIINDYDEQVRVAVRIAANLANSRPANEGIFYDMDEKGAISVQLKRIEGL
ncbi:MAG: substrate-binding domain-containing protein [Neisseriaceae bacterium]|nr:substrate-binding domain-containing protein [Neisseriaceae bacterium]